MQDMSRVISRVHFIVRLLPDISPLLIRTQNGCYCRLPCSQRGEGGLVMAHSGCTAVNITGFYSMVHCRNHGRAVAPRCLSHFDCVPVQPVQHFNSLTYVWWRKRWSNEDGVREFSAQNYFFGLRSRRSHSSPPY